MNPNARAFVWISLVFSGVCGFACVQSPGASRPSDRPRLHALEVHPVDRSRTNELRPELTIRYDGYVDVRRSVLEAAVSLESGVFAVPVVTTWDPVGRTLRAVPLDPLQQGLTYQWTTDETAIAGVGGTPSEPIPPIRVAIDVDAVHIAEPPSFALRFSDVEPVFEAHCSCHGTGELAPLDYDALGHRSTAFPDRRLVRPYEPATSYLVEKILVDYPDRFGTEMPPPWSDGPPLDHGARARIVEWIADGARP